MILLDHYLKKETKHMNNPIEVQLEKEKYEDLKQYAEYASDLTRVCSFPSKLKMLLVEHGVEFDGHGAVKEEKPILTITGRNIMKIENGEPELLHFLGCVSEFDPTVPLDYVDRVKMLIDKKVIIPDKKFRDLYSKMNYKSKIGDLISGNVKFYGKGKLIEYIDPELTMRSMNFSTYTEKEVNYKFMSVKIVQRTAFPDEHDADGNSNKRIPTMHEGSKYNEIWAVELDKKGRETYNEIILRFYQRSPLLKGIFFQGNIVKIAAVKFAEEDNKLKTYDPVILPGGFVLSKEIVSTPPDRKIPLNLARNAYSEFLLRYDME